MDGKKGLFSDSVVYCTALYLAAQNGHKDVVEFISELPMPTKSDDMYRFTAVYLAAMKGNLDVLKYFAGDDFASSCDIDVIDLTNCNPKTIVQRRKMQATYSVPTLVKLRETENPWKPARMIIDRRTNNEDRKTMELYRRVRGILNKLTPQNFSTLMGQMKTLPIDTPERLQGVIDLIFEKAVNEPLFSVAYALMCRELALMQVPSSADNKMGFVNFRKLLVTRCQLEFEKDFNEDTNRRVNEIDDCSGPKKKKEILMSLEEEDRRKRMKYAGNVRFIGELFKQQMLTVNIMMRCLQNFMDNRDEMRLECLCVLLTTVGGALESKKMNLEPIFSTMKDIVDKKNGNVSNKVRSMLQDVIDLRNSNWVSQKPDSNPKIIPKKERGFSSNADRKHYNNQNDNDDNFSTAPSRNKNVQFSAQSDSLKLCKVPTADEPLDISQMFLTQGRETNIATQQDAPPSASSANNSVLVALEKVQDVESPSINTKLSYPQIQEKLAQFIQAKLSLKSTKFDGIYKWISYYVGERMKEKQFIRVLATVVFGSSIINQRLDVDKLRVLYAFLLRYVDGNTDFELQCLYAVQTIVNRLDHPHGLLLKIFNTLFDDIILSHDSFLAWEQSDNPAEQTKKDVAMKQLTIFFKRLREIDEDSASSNSE